MNFPAICLSIQTALCAILTADPIIVPVFESGIDGYHTYRIPALVTAANGDLLAFAEGRVDNEKDNGNIDLVLRRSSDEGETWSALEIVGDLGSKTTGTRFLSSLTMEPST